MEMTGPATPINGFGTYYVKVYWSIDCNVDGETKTQGAATYYPVYMGAIVYSTNTNFYWTNTAARSFLWLDAQGYRHQTISQECIVSVNSDMLCNYGQFRLYFCYDSPAAQAMNVSLVNMVLSPVEAGCDVNSVGSPIDSVPLEQNFLRAQFSY